MVKRLAPRASTHACAHTHAPAALVARDGSCRHTTVHLCALTNIPCRVPLAGRSTLLCWRGFAKLCVLLPKHSTFEANGQSSRQGPPGFESVTQQDNVEHRQHRHQQYLGSTWTRQNVWRTASFALRNTCLHSRCPDFLVLPVHTLAICPNLATGRLVSTLFLSRNLAKSNKIPEELYTPRGPDETIIRKKTTKNTRIVFSPFQLQFTRPTVWDSCGCVCVYAFLRYRLTCITSPLQINKAPWQQQVAVAMQSTHMRTLYWDPECQGSLCR